MKTHLQAAAVLAMLDTSEWTLTRTMPDPSMTAEYLARTAWAAGRQLAPFCDKAGTRVWFGPTAHAALVAAHTALFGAPPAELADDRREQAQLGLYFAVGPERGEDDELNSERFSKSYDEFEHIFRERAMAQLGQRLVGGSDDYRFIPVELCSPEFDPEVVDGHVVYSIWFQAESAIERETAVKLREMALEAYTKVCGPDARFIRGELYERWSYSTRVPFIFES